MKNPSNGRVVPCAEMDRTDMTKANSRFTQLCERP